MLKTNPIRRLFIAATALLTFGSAAPAKHYIYRPVSISVFPLLSTNGTQAADVRSSFSLNILGGYLGRLTGVEIGGLFNAELGDAYGWQVAGATSIVSGDFGGVQQSGAVSIVGRDLYILQQSGALSMVVRDVHGVQMAGGACIALGQVKGAQVSGGANVADGWWSHALQLAGGANISRDFIGAQVAGGANIARGRFDGLQLAGGTNISYEFHGVQVAPVNITGRGHGLQLGVVNIADDIDVPIGIVNIVRNGQFRLNVLSSEAAVVNVGIKTGSKKVYSTIMLGLHPASDSSILVTGLGLGGHIPLRHFFVDVDGSFGSVYRWPHWLWTESADEGYRFLATARVLGGWQATKQVAIVAGPTANLWLSDRGPGPDLPMYGFPVSNFDSRHIAFWPGFTAGLQLF